MQKASFVRNDLLDTNKNEIRNTALWINLLGLFGSTSTLLCCALPALLVVLGLGSAVAGLVSYVPQSIWLTEHKHIIFMISGSLLLFNAVVYWRNKKKSCPISAEKTRACRVLRRASFYILIVAITLWCIGFFFSYFAIYLVR